MNLDSLIAVATPNFAGRDLGYVVTMFTYMLFPLTGLLLVLYMIYGGYVYMTSGANPQKMAQAQGIIVNALLGVGIVFISFWLVQLIAYALGLPDITDIFGSPV